MKIRTRVKITGALALCVILAYGAWILHVNRAFSQMAREVKEADEITHRFFMLHALTYDYLSFPTERAQRQWSALYQELRRLLAAAEYRELQKKYGLEDTAGKLKMVGDTFARLLTIKEIPEQGGPEAETRREFHSRLTTQLLLATQDIVTRTLRMTEEINEKLIATQRVDSSMDIVVLLALGVIIFSAGVFLQRSVVKPVLKLHDGAEIIGAGNLDFKVGITTGDEIGELSQAFDRMTANLQEITVSRNELAKEVEERKLVEEKLQNTLLDLERSNRDLEEFAYISSHDLQEPLRKIANFSEMLGEQYRGRFDEQADRYLCYIADGARRMQALINDLLYYSRVGQTDLPSLPANLEDILRGTLNDLQSLIQESGAHITHDPLPTSKVNSYQMGQLLQNLLVNAIKFHGHQPPRIHLSARQEGREWVIGVRDNGIGFDSQQAERIFKVFQRLHSQDKYPGTGIGLAICKKIVERHGGRCWAESQPGLGSTFYFTIPA